MTEAELYKFHEEAFKPIYADLVAVLGSKPEQIVFELEATLSHVAVAHTNPTIQQENIDKAHGHLKRAALDAVKILWLEYRALTEKFIADDDLRKFATNASEKELLEKYQKANKSAKEARQKELLNTGIAPEEAIDLYYQSAKDFCDVLDLVDPDKKRQFDKFRFLYKKKEIIISFVVGCLSSWLITYLFGS
jgi:hypothetical protein